MKEIEELLKEYTEHLISVCKIKQHVDIERCVDEFIDDCKTCNKIESTEMHVFLLVSLLDEGVEELHPIKQNSHFKALKKSFGI
jgi:hypothetical protein